jgi:hypothetical protein
MSGLAYTGLAVSLRTDAGAGVDFAQRFTITGVPVCDDDTTFVSTVTVVEYYNAALDEYFMTWLPPEIVTLDQGVVSPGWTRTGKTFKAFAAGQPGASDMCRYYIPPPFGDAHFYGRDPAECNATGLAHPEFVLEDPKFMQLYLPVAGNCSTGTIPVYRVYSNRAAPSHRYMIDRATRDEMVAAGWLAEGDGPDLVVMCAPT